MGSSELTDDEINALLQGDSDEQSKTGQDDIIRSLNVDGQDSLDKKKIQKVSFGDMEESGDIDGATSNLNLLMDVPMDVSVEIGRTKKSVQEILSLNIGSVIELNKLSGEPVDLLVNGKVIAKAEVVIIDENFGIRITEIVKPMSRVTFN